MHTHVKRVNRIGLSSLLSPPFGCGTHQKSILKKRERACMAYSAKKWAGFISYIASRAYFFLILLQFPLFRVPCRGGICTTPLEVASCHLIATEVLPAVVVKILLYPGAVADAFLKNKSIPNFNNLLNAYPNFNNLKRFDDTNDIHRIEHFLWHTTGYSGKLPLCSRSSTRLSKAGKNELCRDIACALGPRQGTLYGKTSISQKSHFCLPNNVDCSYSCLLLH
ncbi:hypothetical protein TEA_010735 [Camellia sinensis var. sinensis]|uniref:Uncharacterized protein n=1 Tax=Camellia sinensis var. sinensis TaxID=542762 RepID=A0A4S4DJK5_CAMSN|nr:hypothetical protein TEA_010735 [Camellia sinensis var. sinensis]